MSAYSKHGRTPSQRNVSHKGMPCDIEERLFEVNNDLKMVLTVLLNDSATRSSDDERMWVQGRLLQVEMELKHYRRRRSRAVHPAGVWSNMVSVA